MITPEKVETALRSWEPDLHAALVMAANEGALPGTGTAEDGDAAIASLARHVAACLSTEPIRIEVQPQPAEPKLALW